MGIRSIGTGFDAVYIEGTDEALERLDELMKELGRRQAFMGTLNNILFGEYSISESSDKMLDDVRNLIDTNLRMHEALAKKEE